MKPYGLQSLYRRIASPTLRLTAIRGARALGVRHLVVRIDTNDVCNLRCPMCPLSDPDRVPAAKPMPLERFERLAEQLFPRTRFLYLSCATEPLATPHFDRILDVVGRHGVPFTSYCTNGQLLRDRFIDATLRNRISELIFSVDGASAEVYEKIRVGGSWDVLNERLEALAMAIAAQDGPVPELRFNFTVQQENVHQVAAFADWALGWKPATVQLRMFRPLSGAQKQDDDARTVREFRARLPEVRRQCAVHGVELEVSDVPDQGLAQNVQRELAAGGSFAEPPPPPRINCQLPWITVYVKADGALHPCPVHEQVGNLFTSSYAEIERGAAMTALRNSLRRAPKQVCIDCQRRGASGVG